MTVKAGSTTGLSAAARRTRFYSIDNFSRSSRLTQSRELQRMNDSVARTIRNGSYGNDYRDPRCTLLSRRKRADCQARRRLAGADDAGREGSADDMHLAAKG